MHRAWVLALRADATNEIRSTYPECTKDTYTCETEVTKRAYACPRIEQEVGGLDVSVNDTASVNVA